MIIWLKVNDQTQSEIIQEAQEGSMTRSLWLIT